MGLLNKLNPFSYILDGLGKGIGFLFTSKKLYFSWYIAAFVFLVMIGFSGYIYWYHRDFFFTENVIIYDLTPIVSVYYIGIIVSLIVFVVTIFGRLAAKIDSNLQKQEKEMLSVMNDLALAYQELNQIQKGR